MKQLAHQTFNQLFPSPEELWERGGAEIIDDVPYFDLGLARPPYEVSSEPLTIKDRWRRRKIGEKTLLHYRLNDDIDRLVSVRTLDNPRADFLVTTSTAWTTTVEGYVGSRDDRIAKELGVQAVSVGAEFSAHDVPYGIDLLTDRRTIARSRSISLAKTAQSEQFIIADVARRFDLPHVQYGLGDSRGAMVKPGQTLYADMYDQSIMYTDIKAPCIPKQLEVQDLPKVAIWAGVETLGAAAVIGSLLKDKDVSLLKRTFDANPQALATCVTGIMPALMSGEAGRLVELAPNDMRGHVVLYGHDIVSLPHVWREIYKDKPSVALKDVPRGSHAHLLKRNDLQVDRVGRASEEWQRHGGRTESIDWHYVAKNKKQADLQLVAN